MTMRKKVIWTHESDEYGFDDDFEVGYDDDYENEYDDEAFDEPEEKQAVAEAIEHLQKKMALI